MYRDACYESNTYFVTPKYGFTPFSANNVIIGHNFESRNWFTCDLYEEILWENGHVNIMIKKKRDNKKRVEKYFLHKNKGEIICEKRQANEMT